jgi:hypothetical protein
LAQQQEAEAKRQETEAKKQAEMAKDAWYQSKVARARLLVEQAKKKVSEGDHTTGILLALEAVSPEPEDYDRFVPRTYYIPDASETLRDGLAQAGLRDRERGDDGLLDDAKNVVPRCLTITERSVLVLRPDPPDWCIQKAKAPYDREAWGAWLAGQDVVDAAIAAEFGNFADTVLYKGDFAGALDATKFGLKFDKTMKWIEMNRAHALMYLGRADEALNLHRKNRGTKVPGHQTWEQAVKNDFAKLIKAGLRHDQMVIIEKELARP